MVVDAAGPDSTDSAANSGTASLNQAMCQSSQDKVQSLSQQPSSESNYSNVSQMEGQRRGNCIVKRERRTVSDVLALSLPDSNCCLLGVTRGKTGKPENVLHKCSDVVETNAMGSAQQHLSTRIHKNFEIDVLLTPLSERRGSLFTRPRHVADNVSLFPAVVVTPEDSGLVPKAADIINPQPSVLPCISKNGKLLYGNVQLIPTSISNSSKVSSNSIISVPSRILKSCKLLNGVVEEDVVESILPLSEETSGNCSLIPLQYLSHKNASVDEDAEIDVFVRSFWDDKDSDPKTASEQGFDSCIRGCRLTRKSKVAVSRQTSNATKKRQISQAVRTTISKQQASKDVALGTGLRKLTRTRRKAESKQCKLSSKDQKRGKAGGGKAGRKSSSQCILSSKDQKRGKATGSGTLQSCTMTLRAVKRVNYAAGNCKPQLHNQQKKTSTRSCREKCQSSRVEKKTNNKSKQPTSKKCQKSYSHCGPQPIAARRRGRSYSKSASPLLLSGASGTGQQGRSNGQRGRKCQPDQKSGETCRKRIQGDTPKQPPSKRQKTCKEVSITGSITQRQQKTNARQASSRPVTRKHPKSSRGTDSKNKRSVAQSANEQAATKQEARKRRVASTKPTEGKGNTDIVVSELVAPSEANTVGDSGSSLIDTKKTRSVVMFQGGEFTETVLRFILRSF